MRLRPLAAALAVLLVTPLALAQTAPARSGPYSLELLDESGAPLPSYFHDGRFYTLGSTGQRYTLRIRNGSARRVEVVAAVDGRDVRDGEPSRMDKRGYIVDPYGEAIIDGFRLSQESVAAFRFSSVSQSYASRMGDARDVGVIGVAVFTERMAPPIAAAKRDEAQDLFAGNTSGHFYMREKSLAKPESQPAPSATSPAPPTGELSRRMGSEDHASVADGPVKKERAGLGTEFGEQHDSHIDFTEFQRNSQQPATVLSVRYNDRDGLRSVGINFDPPHYVRDERWTRQHAQPFRRDPGYAQPPAGWYGE